MKTKLAQILSLILAMFLQVAPLLRSFLPNVQGLAPNAWAIILNISVGATALIGFDSVSKASGISISPPNATVGQPYVGTITYSGGHAGSVSSMSYSGTCLGISTPFVDGLFIKYNSVNTATVSGTPTNASSYNFTISSYDGSSCGTGHEDTRSATLIVGSSGTTPTAPSILASPQNTCAQVGTDVNLSGGASGYPIPLYQWWTALGAPIPGATNSILTLTNVQLTDSGIYTMTASNSSTAGDSFLSLPKANCYLSVCITGGTNFSTLDYTNYAPAGVPLTMFSWLTNGYSTTTNYYYWVYNGVNILSTSNTIPFSASSLTPAKSGTFTVYLSSSNSGGGIVISASYDSYWQFGYSPVFTNSLPASNNINAGSNVTFTVGIRGSLDVINVTGGTGGYATNSGNDNVFWYQNNTNLVASQNYVLGPTSGTTYSNTAITASLTLNSLTSANSGNYTVVATNSWGSITSSPVALSVVSSSIPPGIATQSAAYLSLLAGQSTAISVTVTGTPPISYQWQLGSGNLSDGGVYSGTATNTLTLTGVTTNNSGNYSLALTNVAGAITSSVAAVNIDLPPSLAASSFSPGVIHLNANTVTGLNYVVESATNLAVPNWTPVQTNNTGSSGAINFQTNTASGPPTFYRLLFP